MIVFWQSALGQQRNRNMNRQADTYMMNKITNQLINELSDLPLNIRRAAIYKINYDESEFNNENIAFIKGEIEATFRENTAMSVISPPELDPTDKLKIIGSDSTLQLMNIKGRSLADMSPELMEGVSNKYSLSGLMELTVQREMAEGLVVQIRIISPQTREIVWAQSVAAFPVEEKETDDIGKRIVFRFGASLMQNDFSTVSTAPSTQVGSNSTSLNYNFNVGYRQPFNDRNSGYLGFYTGFNLFRANEDAGFEANFWEIGLSFDQAVTDKSESINDYRIMLGLDASVWLAQGNRNGNLIMMNPGIMFNLSKNIGFELYAHYFLTEQSVTEEVSTTVTNTYTYGQLGYGVKAYVQF
ncbi:MAG: hypothetical protein RI564_10265 [Gracilimonas sp.]|nr:hypothetical protein [Gracilimonas sp.]